MPLGKSWEQQNRDAHQQHLVVFDTVRTELRGARAEVDDMKTKVDALAHEVTNLEARLDQGNETFKQAEARTHPPTNRGVLWK